MLLLAFVFFHNEKGEISELLPQMRSANPLWLFAGGLTTCLYVLLQGMMYVYSFRAAGHKISITDAVDIFLKRNLISVFLPAGGITSLAYLTKNIKRRKIPSNATHRASGIYGFVGFLSVVIVGIPLLVYAIFINPKFVSNLWLMASMGVVLLLLFTLYYTLKTKGKLYVWLKKRFPKILAQNEDIFTGEVSSKYFWLTVLMSTLIEFCGILQVLIAMYALGANVTFTGATLGYIISVLLMIVSPFLRGLGAVEFSMAYVLSTLGYPHAQALGVTLLFRLFEFWLPLAAGFSSYFWNGRRLLARLIPTFLIFALGVINILSVLLSPKVSQMELSELFLPEALMHYSKILIMIVGILLLFTAAYMLKGYRRAWYVALSLTVFSIVGNLLKAVDFNEAFFAAIVLLLLLYTRKEYRLASRKLSFTHGFSLFVMLFSAVLIMNLVSFYLIQPQHFGLDFSWSQSIYYTLQTFLFFSDSGLQPQTLFARDFLILNQILGLISWCLLIYSFFKVRGLNTSVGKSDFQQAAALVQKFGTSSMDYFKLTEEKSLYFSEKVDGFVSYRNDRNFAVVLDEPVCSHDNKMGLIQEFEDYCHKKGLRVCWYRVSEESKIRFDQMHKKHLLIGQEGIIDVAKFTMEGKEKKSIRNTINTLHKKGYSAEVLTAPHDDKILNDLQNISNAWLKGFDKKEIVFAEGKFNRNVLRKQNVITLQDQEGNHTAFLNLIPDSAPGECSYDMIRRTSDAPNGSMDLLMIKLVEYAKSMGLRYVNLGMAPLAGLEQADSTAEQIMKFAYNNIKSLKHYHSLRFFKDKYANVWNNKYLIYSNDADLIELPISLNKIMKPED
ncbi:MAG: phosphatidylglycerol lysyltransferase domain-containing protein [Weeksellaceae bacterium]|nr:phosphatidylglycerol lysyltransferase domain-containing protein [Weeksellaceae bacterium]